MNKNKVRVGIIGCGGMARAHVNRFEKTTEQMSIAALVDIELEKASAVAALLPYPVKVSRDYRDILPDVDAVLIVLPHHLHHSVTIECLNAGKHVLVEKPLANSEQECLEMIEAAERNQRVLMVAYSMRFHPLLLKFKQLLDEKTYGEVFQLSIWTEQYTCYPEGHWICDQQLLGGGQLFSHGCHYIDLMLWMLGRPRKGAHFGTNKGTPWMEREGTSSVILEFESGAIGYHGATWGARGTRLRYSFHAHCTGGMIEADIFGGKLMVHHGADIHQPDQTTSQKTDVLLEVAHAKPTAEEMAEFIRCIQTGDQPLTDAVSSLEGLRVIWELYRAEESHSLAELGHLGLGTHSNPEAYPLPQERVGLSDDALLVTHL